MDTKPILWREAKCYHRSWQCRCLVFFCLPPLKAMSLMTRALEAALHRASLRLWTSGDCLRIVLEIETLITENKNVTTHIVINNFDSWCRNGSRRKDNWRMALAPLSRSATPRPLRLSTTAHSKI